ncbi:MAG: GIY-YIG nuclease family protein [Candidatus Nealsonbacteria bacterium]
MNPVRNARNWYVYVLQNKTQSWYIGSTNDLRKRILQHNSGKSRSTKHGVPWKIIYCEISINKQDARARERYLKSGMGRKYLKKQIKILFRQGFLTG